MPEMIMTTIITWPQLPESWTGNTCTKIPASQKRDSRQDIDHK